MSKAGKLRSLVKELKTKYASDETTCKYISQCLLNAPKFQKAKRFDSEVSLATRVLSPLPSQLFT